MKKGKPFKMRVGLNEGARTDFLREGDEMILRKTPVGEEVLSFYRTNEKRRREWMYMYGTTVGKSTSEISDGGGLVLVTVKKTFEFFGIGVKETAAPNPGIRIFELFHLE